MRKIKMIIWNILGYLYIPVYFAFYLLHKVARLLLAITYFGMFEKRMAIDILKNMFNLNGKIQLKRR